MCDFIVGDVMLGVRGLLGRLRGVGGGRSVRGDIGGDSDGIVCDNGVGDVMIGGVGNTGGNVYDSGVGDVVLGGSGPHIGFRDGVICCVLGKRGSHIIGVSA